MIRIVAAVVTAAGLIAVDVSNPVAWLFGAVFGVVVLASGPPARRRRW